MHPRPRISNVVCTADMGQRIDVARLASLPCGIYDEAIYGGRCGYVKTPEMDGRVTVFPSGKMISIGGRSVARAAAQANHARFYMVHNGMAQDTRLSPRVRNIVATLDLGRQVPIDVVSTRIPGAAYDPEVFPGMVVRGLGSCCHLVFASGKIVVTGARSVRELNTTSFELVRRLEGLLGRG